MNLGLAATVFAVLFLAELPDKSMIVSVVLARRFRPVPVWLGICAAFAVHMVIAVAAGRVLALLPHRVVELVVALLFAVGAVMLARESMGDEEPDDEPGADSGASGSALKAAGVGFVAVFIGEWGDITQIAAANFAARSGDPLSVFAGGTLGLWAVSGLGVLLGATVLRRLPVRAVQRVMAVLLAGFAIWSVVAAIRG